MRLTQSLITAAASAMMAAMVWAGDAYPALPDVPQGQQRGERAAKGGELKYWPDRPDQARVLAATFIGGKGHEWLASGGFQSDGTVVLVGNVCGGEFGMSVKESVLGTDGTRPGPAEFKTVQGKTEKPSWTRPDATGFIVLASSDLKTITKVVRLPWASAAVTSCPIGSDGSIYIAGKPGAGIAALGGAQRSLAAAADATRKDGMADAAFVAKLDKTASKTEWVCTSAGKTDAPSVRVGNDGCVSFGAQDIRFFDAAGKELAHVSVPGGVKKTTAVNPKDGSVAACGERNTGTGREPWRMGHLNILEPDGKLRYQLYQWSPRYVVNYLIHAGDGSNGWGRRDPIDGPAVIDFSLVDVSNPAKPKLVSTNVLSLIDKPRVPAMEQYARELYDMPTYCGQSYGWPAHLFHTETGVTASANRIFIRTTGHLYCIGDPTVKYDWNPGSRPKTVAGR